MNALHKTVGGGDDRTGGARCWSGAAAGASERGTWDVGRGTWDVVDVVVVYGGGRWGQIEVNDWGHSMQSARLCCVEVGRARI